MNLRARTPLNPPAVNANAAPNALASSGPRPKTRRTLLTIRIAWPKKQSEMQSETLIIALGFSISLFDDRSARCQFSTNY
jgi:hypothetical protein